MYKNNEIGILDGITSGWTQYCWHHQEIWKGRGLSNSSGATTWSGWNVDENFLGINKISVDEARKMRDNDFKTNTVFYLYPPSMNDRSIPLLTRSAHLALGIPALAPATGAIDMSKVMVVGSNFHLNTDDEKFRPNGWPERSKFSGDWLHSDMKDVAYYYNYVFYKMVVEKGEMK